MCLGLKWCEGPAKFEVACSCLKLSKSCCKTRFADSIDTDAALNRLHVIVFSKTEFLSDNDNVIFFTFLFMVSNYVLIRGHCDNIIGSSFEG